MEFDEWWSPNDSTPPESEGDAGLDHNAFESFSSRGFKLKTYSSQQSHAHAARGRLIAPLICQRVGLDSEMKTKCCRLDGGKMRTIRLLTPSSRRSALCRARWVLSEYDKLRSARVFVLPKGVMISHQNTRQAVSQKTRNNNHSNPVRFRAPRLWGLVFSPEQEKRLQWKLN